MIKRGEKVRLEQKRRRGWREERQVEGILVEVRVENVIDEYFNLKVSSKQTENENTQKGRRGERGEDRRGEEEGGEDRTGQERGEDRR
eukprot:766441-Hanusia_phi.AAC.5